MTSNPDFLLDTNMIGLFLELGTPDKSEDAKRLQRMIESLTYSPRIFICPIVVGEIEYGIRVAPAMSEEKRTQLRRFISDFQMASLDRHVARNYYADLRSALYNHVGRPKTTRPEQWRDPATATELGIQENDLWIVAIAMAYNLSLLTNDKMEAIRTVVRTNGMNAIFEEWK